MEQGTQSYFKKCSSCKKEIPFSSNYYVCSVSTCRHKRKGFHFCSVPCWDAHLGFANHREAWAVEEKSPTKANSAGSESVERSTKRTIVRPAASNSVSSIAPSKSSGNAQGPVVSTDTLVVVSKVKQLIKEQSGYSTSQCCIDALTKKVVEECLKGIEQARGAERKTVMGRDIN